MARREPAEKNVNTAGIRPGCERPAKSERQIATRQRVRLEATPRGRRREEWRPAGSRQRRKRSRVGIVLWYTMGLRREGSTERLASRHWTLELGLDPMQPTDPATDRLVRIESALMHLAHDVEAMQRRSSRNSARSTHPPDAGAVASGVGTGGGAVSGDSRSGSGKASALLKGDLDEQRALFSRVGRGHRRRDGHLDGGGGTDLSRLCDRGSGPRSFVPRSGLLAVVRRIARAGAIGRFPIRAGRIRRGRRVDPGIRVARPVERSRNGRAADGRERAGAISIRSCRTKGPRRTWPRRFGCSRGFPC